MKNQNEKELDKILIKDLLVRCTIGVNEAERKERQDVIINIEAWVNLIRAAKTDDIRETCDYKELNKNIIRTVETSQFYLLETLTEKIAQTCLQHKEVHKVKVTTEKPGALRFAKSVGVEITRTKDQQQP